MNTRELIYLAARYSRREELCRYRKDLEAAGYTVTSRWLNGDHQISDSGLKDEHGDQGFETAERERFALEDREDVRSAGILIAFTEPPRSGPSRGGRHVELGMALERALTCGVRVLIVGKRENVFCCLPEVEVFPHFQACLTQLRLEQLEREQRFAAEQLAKANAWIDKFQAWTNGIPRTPHHPYNPPADGNAMSGSLDINVEGLRSFSARMKEAVDAR